MLALAVPRQVAVAHDIHTTLLHLKWDARGAVLSGTLRIFVDDMSVAAAAARLTPTAYVLRGVRVVVEGREVPLTWCGEELRGDAAVICLRGSAGGVAGMRIRNTLLLERYTDQVNIVRVEAGRVVTLLLTNDISERVVR